jgi:hypothetical protein
VAYVSWLFISIGGCAAISGLDSIQEKDCAPLCGDGQATDVTVEGSGNDSSSGADTSSGNDTGAGDSRADGSSGDGSGDTGSVDASESGVMDSGADAPPEGSSPDAPFDSGCGDLNTVTNCSACGDKCASTVTVETSSSCSGDTNGFGATCSYTCATGYLDCNGATSPPNVDGCECHVPNATQDQCCATSGGDCPIQHKNGLGQSTSLFYDCVPAGTINSQLAEDACVAYVGTANAGDCGLYGPADGGAADSWCSGPATGDCICWTYSGTYMGQVLDPKAQGLNPPSDCYYGPSSETFD